MVRLVRNDVNACLCHPFELSQIDSGPLTGKSNPLFEGVRLLAMHELLSETCLNMIVHTYTMSKHDFLM